MIELKRFLNNGLKGYLIKGLKGSFINGLKGSLIKDLKGSFIKGLKICHKQTNGGIQPTSNWKVKRFYQIIQIRFD